MDLGPWLRDFAQSAVGELRAEGQAALPSLDELTGATYDALTPAQQARVAGAALRLAWTRYGPALAAVGALYTWGVWTLARRR